ncbi:Major facilitator Superfamily [Phytophthora cinnamomi]|uniref:Major facilitator Superfamily n=1 Tax=Phytophthora cinnamomi TaxID=4785 RepID=UPI003559C040|nr:Major facilitator Superfamily [Phytophthora cinnamomi]
MTVELQDEVAVEVEVEVEATLLEKQPVKKRSFLSRGSYRRWFMLGILSVLSAVNQAICYSYAPISIIVEERWEQRLLPEHLITVYFVSYIPCTFIGSWIMDRKGLAYGVILGGVLQTLGTGLRYFACLFEPLDEVYVTLAGQTIASLAMPFMVNSPPLLSANWFPLSMRAASTSVALNANALGTALVYLTAPLIVRSGDDIPDWNLYLALLSLVSCVIAVVFFRSDPKARRNLSSASSSSSSTKTYDWSQWWTAFTHCGFWHTLVAFALAETIINAFSALLDKFMGVAPVSKTQIGIVGAAFIVSSLVGGQIISQQVDKKRNHKMASLISLLVTAVSIALFGLIPKAEIHASLVCLLVLGAVLGAIQPIVLELGVECAFPTSEATVAALQQLCGNFLSAIAVSGLSALQRMSLDATGRESLKYFFVSPEWIMVVVTIVTFGIFCFYNGKYKRYAHESKIVLPRVDQDQVTSINTSTSEEPACFG